MPLANNQFGLNKVQRRPQLVALARNIIRAGVGGGGGVNVGGQGLFTLPPEMQAEYERGEPVKEPAKKS